MRKVASAVVVELVEAYLEEAGALARVVVEVLAFARVVNFELVLAWLKAHYVAIALQGQIAVLVALIQQMVLTVCCETRREYTALIQ